MRNQQPHLFFLPKYTNKHFVLLKICENNLNIIYPSLFNFKKVFNNGLIGGIAESVTSCAKVFLVLLTRGSVH
jgi:hypothetical protein